MVQKNSREKVNLANQSFCINITESKGSERKQEIIRTPPISQSLSWRYCKSNIKLLSSFYSKNNRDFAYYINFA